MNLQVEIITPEKVIYNEEADEVIIPTTTGQIAVLPNHIPLLSQIEAGEIIIKKGAKEFYMAISGGFVEISANKISILADFAIHSEDIDMLKVEEAKKRAEKIMEEKVSEEDFALAEAEFKRAIAQIHVANRRRRRVQ